MPKLPNINRRNSSDNPRSIQSAIRRQELSKKIKLHREVMKSSKERLNLAIKELQIEINKLVKRKATSSDFRRLRDKVNDEFKTMKKKMEVVIKS